MNATLNEIKAWYAGLVGGVLLSQGLLGLQPSCTRMSCQLVPSELHPTTMAIAIPIATLVAIAVPIPIARAVTRTTRGV
jgi:hypothetical protein